MNNIKKIPISVLVVIYTSDLKVLMMKRTAKTELEQNLWQSVTGSLDNIDEHPIDAATRELFEETGLVASQYSLNDWQHSVEYEIFPKWRHRYPDGITQNTEHWFGICVPNTQITIKLSPQEHTEYQWLDVETAAQLCFSWNNALAIKNLPIYSSLKNTLEDNTQ